MKKLVSTILIICLIFSSSICFAAALTQENLQGDLVVNYKYKDSGTSEWTWTVPGTIEFTSSNTGTLVQNGSVSVTHFIGDLDKKLTISINSDLIITHTSNNHSYTLPYKVYKDANKSAEYDNGSNKLILSIDSGTDFSSPISAPLYFYLANPSSRVVGNYTGTLQFVAQVVSQ